MKMINSKRIIITYMILMTLIYICVCLSVNLAAQNYLRQIFSILLYGSFGYVLLTASFIWYDSTKRKNNILRRKIKRINSKILKACSIIKLFLDWDSDNYKKYNKTRKKVNKILSKKSINQTFQPIFNEDDKVLKIIKLFNRMSGEDLSRGYDKHKELFKLQKGIKPLAKFDKHTSREVFANEAKKHRILLKGTIVNNEGEIKNLERNIYNENLYKKYNYFNPKDRIKKLTIYNILVAVLFVSLSSFSVYWDKYRNNEKYMEAISLVNKKQYDDASNIFKELGNFKDSEEQLIVSEYESAIKYINEKKYIQAFLHLRDISGYKDSDALKSKVCKKLSNYICTDSSPLFIKSDGRVYTSPTRYWETVSDAVQLSDGGEFSAVLKSDGTVQEIKFDGLEIGEPSHYGADYFGTAEEIENWKDVTKISCGLYHIVGLKSDGTVYAKGYGEERHNSGQCDVEGWTDIVDVCASWGQGTIGLKSDGTVIISGDDNFDLQEWTDIVAISGGYMRSYSLAGLKSDGTVVVSNDYDVDNWTDIVSVALNSEHVVGLKSDGTVEITGDCSDSCRQCTLVNLWNDIIAISAGYNYIFGLKSDGTIVSSSGSNNNFNLFEL